jgi:AcrR family transcriptional regulator
MFGLMARARNPTDQTEHAPVSGPGAAGEVPPPPWVRRATGPAKPVRQPLDRQAVLAAAIRVLDRDGASGLTMRAVAQELGVAAASLYGHVASKEELVQLVLDRVLSSLPIEYTGDTWQEQLKAFMRAVRSLFRAHPGAAQLTMGRIPIGPNFVVHLEALLGVGRAAGLPDQALAFAGDLLGLYVGAYTYEESLEEQATSVEFVDAMRAWFSSLPPDRFPNVVALAPVLTAGDADERFEWGLDVLIRGLGTFVPGSPVPGSPVSGPPPA